MAARLDVGVAAARRGTDAKAGCAVVVMLVVMSLYLPVAGPPGVWTQEDSAPPPCASPIGTVGFSREKGWITLKATAVAKIRASDAGSWLPPSIPHADPRGFQASTSGVSGSANRPRAARPMIAL